HSILHYLPFAVLPAASSRFLMQDYELAYLPAAAALVQEHNGATPASSLLAMAPARARLQYAQQEVENVGGYFPPHPNVLTGTRATEGSFKSMAAGSQVIHLATHGFFNKL